MKFKQFVNKLLKDFKEYNKPENVKKRLTDKIEVNKLRIENEKLEAERKKMLNKKYNIGVFENGKM